jgi:uncharacterized membrane protein YhaH (DUF805 family)
LFDPRGRCDRRGLLALAVHMMALQVLVGGALYLAGALVGPLASVMNGVFVYAACAASAKRLHDTGRPAWWIVAGVTGVVLWCFALSIAVAMNVGLEALKPDGAWAVAVVAASSAPAFGLLLWLHFAPGETTANAYGPVPAGLGFSRRLGQALARPNMAGSARGMPGRASIRSIAPR